MDPVECHQVPPGDNGYKGHPGCGSCRVLPVAPGDNGSKEHPGCGSCRVLPGTIW